ncbi:MAG: SH3 domain-containing protein [Acetatifactor sp.]|nr:SH3 domain-containing protein [Acetatifactor sp.]
MTKDIHKPRIAFFLAVLLVINCFWNTGILQTRAEELDSETLEYLAFLNEDLQTITDGGEIMAVLYREQKLPVRTAPDLTAPVAAELYSGQTVFITGVALDSDYGLWSQIGFYYQQEYLTGYIERDYLMCTDERYKEWEAANGLDPSLVSTFSLSVSDGDVRSTFDEVNQFPESYRAALDALKEAHPNWHFTPLVTNLDWNTVIDNEMGAKSLVYYTFEDWNKDGLYDEHNWYYATRPILEYYMDPRNGLTEERIFQFEQLTYNESYHTYEAMNRFLTGTFMDPSKKVPGTNLSYPYLIWSFGAESIRRVSPFYLAALIIQEQGRQGTGDLISGTYPGYEGYYNYFNIRATGTTHAEVVKNGLEYAKGVWEQKFRQLVASGAANAQDEANWKALYSAYFALEDGADFISRNYIQKGQDTLYLQKYNVNPNGYYPVYTHQYMQNISAPTTEARNIRNLYNEAGALDMEFNFKIPVYLNMPETAVPYPTIEENLYLTIPEGYDTTTIYVDGVAYPTETKFGYQVANLPNTDAKTAIAYKYNASGVPEGMYVWELTYTQKNKYQVTALPNFENLLSYHGFSIRITGKSGMRFMSGISEAMKRQMTAGTVDGYSLVEYGTLVMSDYYRAKYPMVLDGNKVKKGISFGVENGQPVDRVYKTVDGRVQYTAVLINLEIPYYQTVIAFRPYAVLQKNGKQIVLYGGIRTNSIYSLSKKALEHGLCVEGSPEDIFVKQLIADADAYAAEQAAAQRAATQEEQ